MKRIYENIKIALKSLGSNRLRTFLTMLGIIIGVGAVVAVMGVGAGAEASIIENVKSVGANVITISPGREQAGGQGEMRRRFSNGEEQEEVVEGDLYLEDVYALERESGLLNEVVPTYTGRNSTISYLSWSGTTSVVGTTEDYLAVQGYEIDRGSFFTESDVANMSNTVVLGDTVVSDYFGKINPVGEIIKIDGKNFTVIGTVKSVGSSFGMDPDNAVCIPITTAQYKIYGVDTIDSISAKVVSEELVEEATEEAKEILRMQHKILPGESSDFSISGNTQILEMASTISTTLSVALGGIAAISLLVGGIGIMNIMFVSVTERTREIGIRKAIGAKNRDIMIQFLTESIILSLLGGILGIGFAYLLTWAIGSIITAIITATPIILALSFSTAIGLLFGIFPAMRAARLHPIDSLRYE
ncbi:MAG: ABC transporter permease [Actinobacteria bacterium]|nr:ABC transporter permease [Actinomycetota bacterium]